MRLFVAVELEHDLRSALTAVQNALRRDASGVRWVRPEHLHLTLKFLGEVPDGDVARVSDAIRAAAARCDTFDITVSGSGVFPPAGRVRVIWVGLAAASGALGRCFAAVDAALQPAGIPRERRPFAPHVTLGRVRDDRSSGRLRSLVEAARVRPAGQAVRSLTLMPTSLAPGGPTYTAVTRAVLGPPGHKDTNEETP
ncbi:MAG: RNA 2',3'-cyclic phosphodiesterase [Phycisphaerae bacterium]